MIIDAHTHIFAKKEIKPNWSWEGRNKLIGACSGKTAAEMAKYRDASFDLTGNDRIIGVEDITFQHGYMTRYMKELNPVIRCPVPLIMCPPQNDRGGNA